jgi:hypothetical protein
VILTKQANNCRIKVLASQAPVGANVNPISEAYIGAFWRNDGRDGRNDGKVME